jgi:hypothetical protein
MIPLLRFLVFCSASLNCVCVVKCSVYLLYWYKSTNTDTECVCVVKRSVYLLYWY